VDGEAIRVLFVGSKTTCCESSFVAMLALPEAVATGVGAGSVVVGWGGAESFLFAVVSHKGYFNKGGEEEEDAWRC
jgi:hypothetical protein